MTIPVQHPIHPVLIGRQWHVENVETGEVWGPFPTSYAAIEKTQQLRGGKTAEAVRTHVVRRERTREPW